MEELLEGQRKHLEGTSGENMLELMTYLDVRFKGHACIKDKVKELEKELEKLAVQMSGSYTEIFEGAFSNESS